MKPKQLKSWNGRMEVGLWILQTNKGTKRTWKPTEADATKAAARLGLRVIEIRPGTEKDALTL
jgi:hypothetical protein